MERVKVSHQKTKAQEQDYEPLIDDSRTCEGSTYVDGEGIRRWAWLEYSIFVVLGIAMLWAWNMFLAAAPYFNKRFESSDWIAENFQSTILTVSTVTNLGAMLVLTRIQSWASYPFRINSALIMNLVIFGLLTVSTVRFLDVSPELYFAFVLLMVFGSSLATGLMQNGAFAFAGGFARPEYTQAIMAGQGIAGVLPPLTQIISVYAVNHTRKDPPTDLSIQEASKSAFIYFLTAVIVSGAAFTAFTSLVRRHDYITKQKRADQLETPVGSADEAERAARRHVTILDLFRKLHWIAASVFMCFVVTMFFPVFTAKIFSVAPPPTKGRLFGPEAFIPLAFFFWNLGDLLGRMLTAFPQLLLWRRPAVLYAISLARTLFLPLYMLCNIHGKGALISSDAFYLLVVQLLFGLSNGWLGSNSMMAAGKWVQDDEREAAGSFMSLSLVVGLAMGSLLSFTAAGL